MKYLAFSGNNYESNGGWDDLMDEFDREHDTLQAAIQQACEIALREAHDWLHIVDLDSRQIVFQVG
jgi:hypothetical protein